MSGLIPQSFIDDLLSRVDIVDIVDSRIKLKKTGKNYSGLCPFHQEKSPSFSVEPDKQFYYCFGCGAGGNAIGFVMNYENMDFPQAIEAIASSMGIEVPREQSAGDQKKREKNQALYQILQKATTFYQAQLRQHPQKSRAIDYLKQRGLSGEIARDFGLGYAPPGWNNLLKAIGGSPEQKNLLLDSGMCIENPEKKKNPVYDRFRDRIMYPIRDNRGRVIAFGGRVLGDDKPKYLNSPETPVFHKSEELYGLYEARKKVRKLERILIVEGYMDIIALVQNDIHYCVATLGTATSTKHLRRLFRLVSEVVFCFDGDSAGRDAAWRALQQVMPLMEDGRQARFLFLPDGEDPDSQVRKIGSKEFIRSIAQATQLAEFFFDALGEQVDMDSLEGRAKMGSLAMPHIRQLPQGIFKKLIVDQLSQITGVDQQTLGQLGGKDPDNNSRDGSMRYSPENQSPASPGLPVRPRKTAPRTLSNCMSAVNLILLQPSIVKQMEASKELSELKIPDIELLLKVIQLAQSHPTHNTYQLIGRVYGTPLGTMLTQLLNREQIIPRESIEKEFNYIINNLLDSHRHTKTHTSHISSLIEKAREKLQLRRHSSDITDHDSNGK